MEHVHPDGGNIYIRPWTLEKRGDALPGHTHNFDHTTIITGPISVKVKRPNQPEFERSWPLELGQFKYLPIRKDTHHTISSIAPTMEMALAQIENMTLDELRFKLASLMSGPVRGLCVYAHRTPQGEVVQEYDGYPDSYT